MSLDGKIGQLNVKEKTIVTQDHPPVMLGGLLGSGSAPWPGGTILTRNEQLKLVPWDGEIEADEVTGLPSGLPVGVLVSDTDPAKAESAVYLAHGTVALTALKLADGLPPSIENIYALAQAGIFGV